MKRFVLLMLLLLPGLMCLARKEKDVVVRHKDAQGREIALAGTLTMPEGKAPRGGWPAMVLITGSGAQNRDEEVFGHRPFEVIAGYMAEHGVATLRCDDRGVGGSTGAFDDVTPYDLAADVEAQWQWLAKAKGVNAEKVGLLGHSEGGVLAPMVAARNGGVAFVVMLAGPGVDMRQTLLDQNQRIFALKGLDDTLIARRLDFMRDAFDATDSIAKADTAQLVKRLTMHFRTLKDLHTQGLAREQKQSIGLTNSECYGWGLTMASAFMRTMLGINVEGNLAEVRCPLLAMYGERDCQVGATVSGAAVRRVAEAAAGSVLEVRVCGEMNHLFQKCATGAADEYAGLGQAPCDEALATIWEWLEPRL